MSWIRLLVDVGNSRIKFGLFEESRENNGLPKCWNSVTVDAQSPLPWSQIRNWRSLDDLESLRGFITGSNPSGQNRVMEEWPTEWTPPARVGFSSTSFPLAVKLPEPAKAGIDRLLNAVAANCLRPQDRPVLIVDSGTATTVDAVSPAGEFLGGAILPGFELSARALHHYTALLPLIPLEDLIRPTRPDAVGTNTRAAMQSGLYWGQVGAVRELLSQSCENLGFQNPLVLLTGGGGALLAAEFPAAKWLPHLSLQGLALVLEDLFPSAA